jgi:hypothetical protein
MKDLKPKFSGLRIGFDKPTTLSGLSAPGRDPLQLFDEKGQPIDPPMIEIDSLYSRASKEAKVVNRIPGTPGGASLNPNRGIVRFETLIAVDTNTRMINGAQVSMCTCYVIRDVVIDEKKGKWDAKVIDQEALEFHDAGIHPEQIGWWFVIHKCTISNSAQPIGIITDHGLNSLSAINARKQPYAGTLILPSGMALIYASADTGKTEFIANRAVAECDSFATRLLNKVEAGAVDQSNFNFKTPDASWFTKGRTWDKNPPAPQNPGQVK